VVRRLRKGDSVTGPVTHISSDSVFIALGTRSDGRVARVDLLGEDGELRVAVGQALKAVVVDPEADGGPLDRKRTAEGALGEVSNIINRMRELAIQAANGTLATQDRTTLDTEYQELIAEIDRIASTTTFNGVALLSGTTATIGIQAGINAGEVITVNLQNTTTGAGGVNLGGTSVTDVANATAALAVIDTAVNTVTTARGALGSAQNRLQSSIASIASAKENLAAAESRIRDVDVAEETADLTRNTILQQAAVSVLAQANVQPQLALSLLQG
jgi:flagellin